MQGTKRVRKKGLIPNQVAVVPVPIYIYYCIRTTAAGSEVLQQQAPHLGAYILQVERSVLYYIYIDTGTYTHGPLSLSKHI